MTLIHNDCPTGHATWGLTWALILTALARRRSLDRCRAYGDSSFVCGAHNASAVEAGVPLGWATMALVSTKPASQSGLGAARTELASLRAGGAPAVQGCDAEAALVAERVMPKLDWSAPKAR